MRYVQTMFVVVCLLVSAQVIIFAQNKNLIVLDLFDKNDRVNGQLQNGKSKISSEKNEQLKKQLISYSELEIKEQVFTQLLASKPSIIRFSMPFRGQNEKVVTLEKFSIFTPDAIIQTTDASGVKLLSIENILSYKGTMEGEQNSTVVLTVSPEGVVILSRVPEHIETIRKLDTSNAYIQFSNYDVKTNFGSVCGMSEESINEMLKKQYEESIASPPKKGTSETHATGKLQVNLAVETDYDMFLKSQQNAQTVTATVNQIIASVSQIYERDINTIIRVSFLNVWQTSDPFIGKDTQAMLYNLLDYYKTNRSSTQRTLAHLLSGRNVNGGIAFLDGLCNNTLGMGVSTGINLQDPGSDAWNMTVVAHEIGHNFGSPHGHSCLWPSGKFGGQNGSSLDKCYKDANEGECFNSVVQSQGTIMSYCHVKGGIGAIDLNFHPWTIALMRSNAEKAACINTTSAPQTFRVSGRVSQNGVGIAGVGVSTGSFSAVTDVNGNYSLQLPNGTYTLRAAITSNARISSQGVVFTPASISVGVNNGNLMGQDFTLMPFQGRISGRVLSPTGTPISGVTVQLFAYRDNRTTTVQTDNNGNYTFSNVSSGFYSLTGTKENHTIQRAETQILTSDVQTNLVGSEITYFVEGFVRNMDRSAQAGTTVSMSVNGQSVNATSDATGYYKLSGIPRGSYALRAFRNGFQYNPASGYILNFSGFNFTPVDFQVSSTQPQTFLLSGRITQNGTPLNGASVFLSDGRTVNTNNNGEYSFGNLSSGSYTVTPSQTGVVFTPTSISAQVQGANSSSNNFMAVTRTYSLSGRVTNAAGAGVSGVSVVAGTSSARTDNVGNYTISNLAQGARLIVTPNGTGVTFNPPSREVTIGNQDQANVSFTTVTVPAPVFTIRGKVTRSDGSGVEGVTIRASSSISARTDATGAFSFSGITAGTYTLIPTLSDWTIFPQQRAVTVNTAIGSQSEINFSGTRIQAQFGSIAGSVLMNGGGIGGVIVQTNTGLRATSNEAGIFQITDVPIGNYTVTAAAPGGMTLSPLTNTVSVASATSPAIANFQAQTANRTVGIIRSTPFDVGINPTSQVSTIDNSYTILGSGPTLDDNMFAEIPLGFNFLYNQQNFNKINISTDGWVSIQGSPARNAALRFGPLAVNGGTGVVAICAADLRGNPNSKIGTKIISSAGGQTISIVWENMSFASFSGSTITMEMLLNQNGTVTFRYGNVNLGNTSSVVMAQVGLRGLDNTDFCVLYDAWSKPLRAPISYTTMTISSSSSPTNRRIDFLAPNNIGGQQLTTPLDPINNKIVPPIYTFSWTKVEGASSYFFQIGTNATFTGESITERLSTNTRSLTMPGLQIANNEKQYFWRTSYLFGTVQSSWTLPASFTIQRAGSITAAMPNQITQGQTVTLTLLCKDANTSLFERAVITNGKELITSTSLSNRTPNSIQATFTIPANTPVGPYSLGLQGPINVSLGNAVTITSQAGQMASTPIISQFNPSQHTLAFTNNEMNVFPASLWQQVNYNSSAYTNFGTAFKERAGQTPRNHYPLWNDHALSLARIRNPYSNINGQPTYDALMNWNPKPWTSSEMGFIAASLMLYNGNYSYLSSRGLNDTTRRLINRHAAFALSYLAPANQFNTPNETVAKITNAFGKTNRTEHPGLRILTPSGVTRHLIPFAIYSGRLANNDIVDSVQVYDPNLGNSVRAFVVVNRTKNTWAYNVPSSPMLATQFFGSAGMFTYINGQIEVAFARAGFSALPSINEGEANDHLTDRSFIRFNSVSPSISEAPLISVSNEFGQNFSLSRKDPIGDGSDFNGAAAIIDESSFSVPQATEVSGVSLPSYLSNKLSVQYQGNTNNRNTFAYSNGKGFGSGMHWNASNNQTPHSFYLDGSSEFFAIKSPVASNNSTITLARLTNRSIQNVETPILDAPKDGENIINLVNTNLAAGDSLDVQLFSEGEQFLINNYTTSKNYTLVLERDGKEYRSNSIKIDSNESHFIAVEDWRNLDKSSIVLNIDRLQDGKIDSTIILRESTLTTSVKDQNVLTIDRASIQLDAYPNPSNGQMTLEYSLPLAAMVQIDVVNLLGQPAATVLHEQQFSGKQTVSADLQHLRSGTYFLRIRAGNATVVKPVQIIR